MTEQLPQWMSYLQPVLAHGEPAFVSSLGALMGRANRPDDPLDARVRILIAMALDMAGGSEEGAASMSMAARGFGVTDAQITDAVKVLAVATALQRLDAGGAAFGVAPGASGGVDAGRARLAESDPEFGDLGEQLIVEVFAESADGLSSKDKHLIRLALDAGAGSPARVKYGAERCRANGASEEEILGALKMAFVNAILLRLAGGLPAFPD